MQGSVIDTGNGFNKVDDGKCLVTIERREDGLIPGRRENEYDDIFEEQRLSLELLSDDVFEVVTGDLILHYQSVSFIEILIGVLRCEILPNVLNGEIESV
jgi:hypothetical protein